MCLAFILKVIVTIIHPLGNCNTFALATALFELQLDSYYHRLIYFVTIFMVA
jgi:hypothetical protein